MGIKRVDRERSFTATDDEGKVHIIDVFVEIHDAGASDNPRAEAKGLRILKTRRGLNVNRRSAGKYQIVQTGQILKSDYVDAP